MVWIKDNEGNLRNLDKINHIVKRQSDKFYYINFFGIDNYHFEEEFDNEALRDGRFDELEEMVIPKSQYERHKEFVKKCRLKYVEENNIDVKKLQYVEGED